MFFHPAVGKADFQMAGQFQILETLLVAFAKVQCLKSTGQNIDQTLVEFSATCQCMKTAWRSNLLQTLIEATTKGQDLKATRQSHLVQPLIKAVAKH